MSLNKLSVINLRFNSIMGSTVQHIQGFAFDDLSDSRGILLIFPLAEPILYLGHDPSSHTVHITNTKLPTHTGADRYLCTKLVSSHSVISYCNLNEMHFC